MKKLAIVFAVGAAALLGGSAANAADNTVKAKAATDVTQPSTDFSSRGRHYRHYGYRHYGYRNYGHRHYGYRSYRPYYGNSYGYAPQPYYGGYGRGYGYGGPGVTFSFGGGGYRGW
jgi:hypothetical protein